ncbi:uncharacterized protein OCT59_027635 [Rhizophagus irregularis]|uniref:uncharacterized protein n=1 Tax=Rhizophagus irregularis TaxID=588596 RepID=UPI0033192BE1|nr:hypothetical protein OCT59_027635 [Rhizophagus irregularis]
MRRKLDQASSSSQSATLEADIVEIVTERKVIHFSADEDLLSIIWIANLKLWIRMKILFYLKADSYYQLPCIEYRIDIFCELNSIQYHGLFSY